MQFAPAPLFEDVAGGPPDGGAVWVETSDGVRIRVGYWRPEAARGTVLLLPGRSEYIEKYGRAAADFATHGFATLVIDWRGQGLTERPLDDRRVGHIDRFTDFQHDLNAALKVAEALDLPRPWHLLGHSMGGAIGLRAVMQGAPVQSCAFTGPMWGIRLSPLLRPMGWALSHAAPVVGLGHLLPPTTTYDSYVQAQPFEGNSLTTDPGMYKMMQDQLDAHPELALGGPSLVWLRESLRETRHLATLPAPRIPCATFVGIHEQIVDMPRIHDRMASWPNGSLTVVPECQHEVFMETPAIRTLVTEQMVRLFTSSWDSGQQAQQA